MKINKWTLIILVFLLMITALRLTWMHFLAKLDYPAIPSVTNGVLDLRGLKFSDKQTLQLNGEWDFYPSTFITTKQQAMEEKRVSLQVPNNWKKVFEDDRQNSLQYGTYRLRILLDKNYKQEFGIRITDLNNASAIFINGQLIGKTGQPAQTINRHKARNIPYSVFFKPDNNEIELLIHVSNNRNKGGIIKPIRFGTMEAINFRTYLSIGLQLLLCVVLLLHCVYAIILYFIDSTPRKGLLYFSMLLICAIFSVLVTDERLFFRWFFVDFKWSIKILFLTYIGVGAFIPPLMNQLFPSYINRRALQFYATYCVLYALFVFLAPPIYILQTSKVLLNLVLIFSIILSTTKLRKAITVKEETIFLLLGCLSIGVNIIWASVKTNTTLEMMHYPFDLIFALLCFAAFWFKRFLRLSNEAKQLSEKLKLEDKRKDDFLINTSHELRNPLHSISTIIQTVLDDKNNPLSMEHRKRLDILTNVSKRMSLMLNDLLDVTRLKEKTIQLHVERINIQTVVAGVLDMIKLMLQGKPIQLEVDIPETFPSVKADENRLIQILFNLIHNAVKYTDEGKISIQSSIVNGMALIHIEDTGIGIEEEVLQKIFLPYEQATVNPMRSSGGFGLGLSISKQLVELHNGTITVSSTPGKGSTFTFSLPLYDDFKYITDNQSLLKTNKVIEMGDVAATTEGNASIQISNEDTLTPILKPKILAVDDDNVNLHVLISILSEEYNITTVTSAQQAIEKLETEHFDLVLSDVMMPKVSGYELTRIIRERFSISELPVLLLTARYRSEDILAGFQLGANDYVTKPVDTWELKARVGALTNLKHSIEERIRMEGAWLQSQIQPHFLFNTLNSIAALGMIDTTKMQELLEEFSNYLRLSIDFQNSSPVINLEHELSLVQSYLYIEKTRFGDRLKLLWELDTDLKIKIPPLTIQPLVENAVKHGILRRSGGGTICLRIKKYPEFTEVSVTDDGIGMTKDELEQLFIRREGAQERTGIGIRNVDRRLKQLYREGLNITSTPNQGTTVTFKVPK